MPLMNTVGTVFLNFLSFFFNTTTREQCKTDNKFHYLQSSKSECGM